MNTDTTQDSKAARWGLAGIVLAACLARGWLLFSTPLMPGINGAYYLVQARSLLTHGALGIPDLPLTFCIQAALGWLLHFFTGGDLDRGIVLGVKLADAILPALIALPVYALVRRWGKTAGAPVWIALAAAAMVTLDAPALRMVGDFEKNSLGLVWLAALLWRIHRWLNDPTPRNAIWVTAFWGLVCVTHIAIFGTSLLLGGLAILFYLATHRAQALRMLWPLVAATAVVGLLMAGLVFWKFDAHRVTRLASALMHPADFIAGNNMPQLPPMPAGNGGPGGMPPGTGMTIRFGVANRLPSALFGIVSLGALAIAWRRRRELPAAEVCVAVACAVGVLVITGPWVQGDKTMRFNLIAVLPAVLAGAFAVQHWEWRKTRATLFLLAMAAMILPSFALLRRGGEPVVSEADVVELRSLAPLIKNPERTLITARHGVEWWVAWTLHTHIAHSDALRTADWQAFDNVYFLRSKHGFGFPGPGGMPPNAGKFGFLDRLFMPGPPPGMMQRGGPPQDAQPGAPGMPPQGGMMPPPGGGPRMLFGGPMSEPEIPRDAQTVHDGAGFTLARVPSPPDFVTGQTPQ